MKKEEFIRRYGEDAWAKACAQSRRKQQERKDYYNMLARKEHKERLKDPAYKEYKRKNAEKTKLKLKSMRCDTYDFVNAQTWLMSQCPVDDLDKYIIENLTREAAEIDGEPRLIDEDFLYEHFVENCQYGLFYGNLQVIKYFVPLMCVKVHKGIELNLQNIEMIKVFDNYKNTTNKRPIKYSFKFYYIRPEHKNNLDICMKCMLLFNLSADFMQNKSRYSTEKKLY